MKNLIIFTPGGGGSSVLTALIASLGYWLGEKTRKIGFDTFENDELVELNIEILSKSGFKKKDCLNLPCPSIEKISNLITKIDLTPFKAFVKKCDENSPWIWKDPRLCYTIHFWSQLVDINDCNYIFTTREFKQEYISMVYNRRILLSFDELRQINKNDEKSCDFFISENHLKCFKCTFEEMIIDPIAFLAKLNMEFNYELTMNDFNSVYKGSFYKKKYNSSKFYLSQAIYWFSRYILKNHIEFPIIEK